MRMEVRERTNDDNSELHETGGSGMDDKYDAIDRGKEKNEKIMIRVNCMKVEVQEWMRNMMRMIDVKKRRRKRIMMKK